MAIKCSVRWESASQRPNTIYGVPVGINKENYIVICGDGIKKYNFETDTWSKMMNKRIAIYPKVAALDTKKKELWMYNRSSLAHIQLHGNYVYTNIEKKRSIGVAGKSIFINNSLHIIGGSDNNCIIHWNSKKKQFTNVCKMYGEVQLSYFGLVHIKNDLFLVGGYDYAQNKYTDSILQYNITQNEWYKLPALLPCAMWGCVCTTAIRNKFVLIFGGRNHNIGHFDHILIYSIKQKTIKISKIKSPSTNIMSAITVSDNDKDEKIVFGFTRNTWTMAKMENNMFPPYYLLKLIQHFYLNEFVYLLERSSCKHWKMSTLAIF